MSSLNFGAFISIARITFATQGVNGNYPTTEIVQNNII